jgi:hypothetical protein
MKKFSSRIFIALALVLFLTVPGAMAATVTFEAVNVTGLNVAGFIMNWEGISGASFASGSALTSWFSNTSESGGVTQVESVDLLGSNPMVDGVIGILTYTGTIAWNTNQFANGYEFRQKGNIFIPMMMSGNLTDGGTVTFDAVPIPSTIVLLGGGLLGLVALRRRRSQG